MHYIRMALDNIRQRLQAQFGEGAELTAKEEAGVYRAILCLPIDREDLS